MGLIDLMSNSISNYSISQAEKFFNDFSDKRTQAKFFQMCIYLNMGWALIPLAPQGKAPLSDLLPEMDGRKSWKPLTLRPPTAPEIKDWLEQYPNLNIGIATGQASDLVVVDIDRPDLVDIEEVVEAPKVWTSEGFHLYLSGDSEGDINQLKTSDDTTVGDIQRDGNYVVAPPSIHEDGAAYRWDEHYNCSNYTPPTIDISKTFHSMTRIIINSCHSRLLSGNIQGLSADMSREDTATEARPQRRVRFVDDHTEKEIAFRMMKMLDVVVDKLGEAFYCPFHEEDHPSASLWRPENGYIAYHDWHRKGGEEWYTLADVYCAIKTGKELQRLGRGEGVVWWLRALYEMGYIEDLPPLLCRKLPEPWDGEHYEFKMVKEGKEEDTTHIVKSWKVKEVYDKFQLLLRLRLFYDEKQRGTPFSHRFGARWCNINRNDVGKAMRYLMQKRFISVLEERSGRQANILDVEYKN